MLGTTYPWLPRVMALAVVVATLGPVRAAYAEPVPDLAGPALRDAVTRWAPSGGAARIDPATGAVRVALPGQVPARIAAFARRYPDRLRVEAGGRVVPFRGVIAGHEIDSPLRSCTAGFIAYDAVEDYIVTAGHCILSARWSRNGDRLGDSTERVFNLNGDYGLIVLNRSFAGEPKLNQGSSALAVRGWTSVTLQPPVQLPVTLCKYGRATGRTCGEVLATDATVTTPGGVTVGGLIETTICAAPLDSGAPLYSNVPVLGGGVYAAGIYSVGTENLTCSDPNFRSYFQPIREVLDFFGVELMTA